MNGHGGQIWDKNGERVLRLDFSANLWPERGLGLPSGWRRALEPYPDPECRALLREASRFYRLPAERILPVNGAVEGLYLIFRQLRPRRVAVFTPSFSEYEAAARWGANGAPVEIARIPASRENGFVPGLGETDLEAGCAVLGNPNNPTGTLVLRPALRAWLEQRGRAGGWTLIDEAFMDFVAAPGGGASMLGALGRWPRLIVLRSMTKRFGIAGVRLGFVLAAPGLIAALRAAQIPWSVNSLAQRLGVRLMRRPADPGFAGRIAVEREFLTRGLRRLGLRVFPGAANFVLFQLPPTLSGGMIIDRLRRRGIGLRDASNFAGLDGSYLRTAVRPRRETRQLLAALRTELEVAA